MKYQRGLGTIELIAGGVVLLLLMGTITGFIIVHDNGVKTKALAPWQPIIQMCQPNTGFFSSNPTPAECAQYYSGSVAKNVSLQADVDKNKKETAECNKQVKIYEDASKDMKANRKQTEAANARKIDAAVVQAVNVERALAAARAGAERGVSCPKSVAKLGSVLLPVATDRVRDFSTPAGAPSPSGAPGTPVHPGPDAVRIGK
jgi:hypothetical protein